MNMMLIVLLTLITTCSAQSTSQTNDVYKALRDLQATINANQKIQMDIMTDLQQRLSDQEVRLSTLEYVNSQMKLKIDVIATEQKNIINAIGSIDNNTQTCCMKLTTALSVLTQPSTTPEMTTQPTKTPPTTTIKPYITDCDVHTRRGSLRNGVYSINVHGLVETKAWCNNGYTVIQSRKFGDQRFDKTWKEYSDGFGKAEGDHWMGLTHQHILTRDRTCQLQVQLLVDRKAPNNLNYCRSYGWSDCAGQVRQINGDDFRISSEIEKFRIRIKFNSTDFLHPMVTDNFKQYFNGNLFSTIGHDNDKRSDKSCVSDHGLGAGFWYHYCHPGYPNTKFFSTSCGSGNAVCGSWYPYVIESSILQFRCQ